MSPTTLRPGARALGALLLSAALVGAPAVAQADDASPSPSATATPSGSPSATTTPDASASPTPSETAEPSPSATATAEPSPSATTPASPKPSASPTDEAPTGLVPGGDARRYGVAAAQGPATSTDPVLVGANFLEEQLRVGDRHYFSYDGFDFPYYGATADAVLGLDAAGTGQDEATLATEFLAKEANVKDYIGVAYSGHPGEVASGAVAKLLNVAVAQKVDPTSFGGVDLVATLQGREQPTGRYTDLTLDAETGEPLTEDYSNVFGQSFGLIGLHRAGAGPSDAAVAYLAAQQCPGGGFQLYMTDAGCSDSASADPDATAMAVQALIAVGGRSTEANQGLDYLAGIQDASGGVPGAGLTAVLNANSTGLAGQAFLAGGRTAQARLAQSYLRSLQFDCTFPAALRGGIAYDRESYEKKVAQGADAKSDDQVRRSTAQALLALVGTPLGSVTATGADAEAPDLACASASPTASPSGSATSTSAPTSTGGSTSDPTGTAGSGGGSTTDPVAAGPTGSLAQTGSEPLVPVLVGLVLLVLGGVAVALSRGRRGAHA
ncbi:hypothetical protein KMZ32_09575 [Phycicoccus sp. MAQZ13P-2]|uniref:hypothetical protein n=1 Tax=Phycicoccus mangrovi TaxID=2840470 RepID=UPI001C0009AA|nr:hypothetical protein [Phycicoccus mangrovi]MBT9255729.1 hypothetical protein [Phycicoccus mangrovi]MBT9274323.1 hypothetical protein [Phycicoccus mangrovi]